MIYSMNPTFWEGVESGEIQPAAPSRRTAENAARRSVDGNSNVPMRTMAAAAAATTVRASGVLQTPSDPLLCSLACSRCFTCFHEHRLS
jgi:hypothetical protein